MNDENSAIKYGRQGRNTLGPTKPIQWDLVNLYINNLFTSISKR